MIDATTRLLDLARQKQARVATAESCTAGMIAAAITDIAGSSSVFECGFVTYSNAAKIAILGVGSDTLAKHGAVSEAVALEMAQGALRQSQATHAVSVTGIAGPGGSEYKPEGRVCFALAQTGAATRTTTVEFGAIGRIKVRQGATRHALDMLILALS